MKRYDRLYIRSHWKQTIIQKLMYICKACNNRACQFCSPFYWKIGISTHSTHPQFSKLLVSDIHLFKKLTGLWVSRTLYVKKYGCVVVKWSTLVTKYQHKHPITSDCIIFYDQRASFDYNKTIFLDIFHSNFVEIVIIIFVLIIWKCFWLIPFIIIFYKIYKM